MYIKSSNKLIKELFLLINICFDFKIGLTELENIH